MLATSNYCSCRQNSQSLPPLLSRFQIQLTFSPQYFCHNSWNFNTPYSRKYIQLISLPIFNSPTRISSHISPQPHPSARSHPCPLSLPTGASHPKFQFQASHSLSISSLPLIPQLHQCLTLLAPHFHCLFPLLIFSLLFTLSSNFMVCTISTPSQTPPIPFSSLLQS